MQSKYQERSDHRGNLWLRRRSGTSLVHPARRRCLKLYGALEMTYLKYRHLAAAVVADWPPLGSAQVDILRTLLMPDSSMSLGLDRARPLVTARITRNWLACFDRRLRESQPEESRAPSDDSTQVERTSLGPWLSWWTPRRLEAS